MITTLYLRKLLNTFKAAIAKLHISMASLVTASDDDTLLDIFIGIEGGGYEIAGAYICGWATKFGWETGGING